MTNAISADSTTESLNKRLGELDARQVAAWRQMSPARGLEIAFQAYQFALDTVRLMKRRRITHDSAAVGYPRAPPAFLVRPR